MRSASCVVLILAFVTPALVSSKPIALEEVVITATRSERDLFWTPASVSVVTEEELSRFNFATTTPELLREEAGIFAQVTTPGQGSPFIRNLTGYHTLILVDTVRLNNSTFRSGPNQYLATIPLHSVSRIEVLRGSGSSLYGTFAMGGVINVITKEPAFSEEGLKARPFLSLKLASANRERAVGGGFEVNAERFALLVEGAFRQVGDVRPGKGVDVLVPTPKDSPYRGAVKTIINSNPNPPPETLPEGAWTVDVEAPTNWKGYTADAKLRVKLGEGVLKLGYQASRQPDVPRYDKVSTRVYEEYFFSPQNRDLIYANYRQGGASITLSYHRQEEGRKSRKWKKTKRTIKHDTVHTLGISAQLTRSLSDHKLTVGTEFYYDALDSWREDRDVTTGEVLKRTKWGRFPDGSTFWDFNLFGQAELKLTDRAQAVLGARFTRYETRSDLSSRDPAFGVFESGGNALTGNAGLIFNLIEGVNLYANVYQGFRAPTLNDTTAVEVTNEGIDAPSPHLKPEKSISMECGAKFRSERFSGSVAFYHMKVFDLVTRVPVEEFFAGQEIPKLYRDIQAEHPEINIFVHANIKEAVIRGVEAEGRLRISEKLTLYGNLSFTRGKDVETGDPIRREQPLRGTVRLLWEPAERAWVEFFIRGAAKQDRLSPGDKRDPRIQMYGTPGWYTLNLRAGTGLPYGMRLSFAVENILNRRYREHGMGVDGLGRNFIVELRR
ncbi:hypothetical protein DRP77_05555 [Candidatus Poribacteria bacterium]|nr:MAG: hypothetical protein DRP77_05555 [Candidatus Poribacteria bacterium]